MDGNIGWITRRQLRQFLGHAAPLLGSVLGLLPALRGWVPLGRRGRVAARRRGGIGARRRRAIGHACLGRRSVGRVLQARCGAGLAGKGVRIMPPGAMQAADAGKPPCCMPCPATPCPGPAAHPGGRLLRRVAAAWVHGLGPGRGRGRHDDGGDGIALIQLELVLRLHARAHPAAAEEGARAAAAGTRL